MKGKCINVSNRVSIQFCTFQNIDSNGNSMGDATTGFRIYDDYGQLYDNCYESVEEMIDEGINEEAIFKFVESRFFDSFHNAVVDKGIYLNGIWIDYPSS